MIFSPTDAAFEGFRITREKPRVVAVWALLYLAVGLFNAWVMMSTGAGPAFMAFQAAAQTGSQDPEVVLAMLGKAAPYAAVALPVTLLLQAVTACAVYRVILQPQDGARAYLKFGADELRMAAVICLLGLLALGVLFAVGIVIGVVHALFSALGTLAALIDFLVKCAAIAVAVWAGVRLSLAGPLTFATREIHLFRSWPLTRGRFWPLFGTYVMATAMILVVLMLIAIIYVVVVAILTLTGGGDLAQVMAALKPDMTSMQTFFRPITLLNVVIGSVMRTLWYVVILAPPAMAYAALAGDGAPAAP